MIKTETRLSVSDSMLERLSFVVTHWLLAMLLIDYLSNIAQQHLVFTALHWMQGGRVRRKLSVGLSVCLLVRLSSACIVTKRKKDLPRFLYHTKDHLA